jgi:hypothetical protein
MNDLLLRILSVDMMSDGPLGVLSLSIIHELIKSCTPIKFVITKREERGAVIAVEIPEVGWERLRFDEGAEDVFGVDGLEEYLEAIAAAVLRVSGDFKFEFGVLSLGVSIGHTLNRSERFCWRRESSRNRRNSGSSKGKPQNRLRCRIMYKAGFISSCTSFLQSKRGAICHVRIITVLTVCVAL